MNRNQLIFLTAISVLLILYTHFYKPVPTLPPDTMAEHLREKINKKPQENSQYGIFEKFIQGEATEVSLENEVIKVICNTKGGGIQEVILKNYKNHCHEVLSLLDKQSSQMGLQFLYNNLLINTKELFFELTDYVEKVNDTDAATATFILRISPTQYIRQIFTLPYNTYSLQYRWEFVGMESYINKDVPMDFIWNEDVKRLEEDVKAAQQRTTINYYLIDESFKSLKEGVDSKDEQNIEHAVKWMSIKQRFFTAAIIGDTPFQGGYASIMPIVGQENSMKRAIIHLIIPIVHKQAGKGTWNFFFGPNQYAILKTVTPGFEDNISLGWVIVKWINKLVIIPIFTFLEKHISNYGLIILLLVLIIKLFLTPLSYKSYVSMAKMKVLKPELDKIKAKYSKEPQKAQMEQVRLYKDVGINPMSGCMPVLLQMPILLAMFNFFPNAIELRQKSFLWAHDLSTYDAIIKLPFHVPLYGNHVSLFTLLMALSTLLYTWSNNQTAATEGPMKGFSYIMPFTLLFILNSFSAGLSFYYFVSNVASFFQQLFVKRFIDEQKIKEKIIAYKNNRSTQTLSKFQDRVKKALQRKNTKDKMKKNI